VVTHLVFLTFLKKSQPSCYFKQR